MFTQGQFRMRNAHEVADFIRNHSFGVLVSDMDRQVTATHVPFLYNEEKHTLFTHLARANPQWKSIEGQQVLVIFSGPHAYISPSWYEEPNSVPTWNYTAVHIRGNCRVIDQEEPLVTKLESLVRSYEPDSDLPSHLNEAHYRNLTNGIVGLQIEIVSVENKAKLSQNKSIAVQRRVIQNLRKSGEDSAQGVARLMQNHLDHVAEGDQHDGS